MAEEDGYVFNMALCVYCGKDGGDHNAAFQWCPTKTNPSNNGFWNEKQTYTTEFPTKIPNDKRFKKI